ncbi:MAG: beta-glucuronidase [Vicinamibacteria bacterium]|nr:beta-glucuronidase [Vicinamibacteria bacterium]
MRRTIGPCIAVCLCSGILQAFDLTFLANVDGRATTSLNGKWRAIVDPYENGFFDYRYEPRSEGFFMDRKQADKSDLLEYDFDKSQTLDVPGDWNTQRESLFFYEGTIWYKKSFDYALTAGRRLFVRFGAVNQRAVVFLNGRKLGEHEGGFTPFAFEITDRIHPKDNSLVVKADNRRRRDAIPTVMTDWWNYGGLTRRVLLVEVPGTFVEDYFVQLARGSRHKIAGWVRLNGGRRRQQVAIEIPEARVRHVVTTSDNGYATFRFDARVEPWSPENPKLYDVVLNAETDSVREAIGFRTVDTRGGEILLNDKPIFLRGVSIHEEAPFRGGRAFSPEQARTMIEWVKELGGNFARLAHYPHNEHMVREADRVGILLWSEVPLYWTIQWDNPRTFEDARRQIEENIARDKNRASIVLWSAANETPVSEARTAFLVRLIERMRELDPTRLVTAALERRDLDDGVTQMIDDPLGAHLDVIGCNEYIGWYDGLPEECDRVSWKTIHDKPLIMSELGGGALAGLHGDALMRWSEEYQESLYEHQLSMLDRIPFLRGISPWILMDFRSPRRPLPGIQDYWNRKGLLSERGERKKAFFVLQRYYQQLMMTEKEQRFRQNEP